MRAALLVSLAMLLSACRIIGDPGHGVFIHNATGARIVLYSMGGEQPALKETLQPDATIPTSWTIPSGPNDARQRKVEAEDLQGRLLFCRRYTYAELDRIRWRVEIVSGQLNCESR